MAVAFILSFFFFGQLSINRLKFKGTFWHHASHDSSSSLTQCFFLIFIEVFNWCMPLWRERTELKFSIILSKMTEQNRNKNLHSAFRSPYNFYLVDILWSNSPEPLFFLIHTIIQSRKFDFKTYIGNIETIFAKYNN